MAITKERCPRCGNDADVRIGQGIAHGEDLVWSLGMKCPVCGLVQEADDRGFPPEGYRRLIIDQDGAWNVVVLGEGDRRQTALVAKELFGLSVRDAAQFARQIPGPVWTGTECEAAWLQRHLQRRGIVSTLHSGGKY